MYERVDTENKYKNVKSQSNPIYTIQSATY